MPSGEDERLQHRHQQTLQGGASQRLQFSELGEAPVCSGAGRREGEEAFGMTLV